MAVDAVKADAVVIGQGIAGFAAAIGLHARNRKVVMVGRGPGGSAVSSGSWDLGRIPSDYLSSLESLCASAEWKDLYQRVLIDKKDLLHSDLMVSALREVASALAPDLDIHFALSKPLVLPTSAGTLKKTFVAQKIQAASDLSQLARRKIGFVCAKNWRLQAESLCRSWQSAAEAQGIKVEFVPLPVTWPVEGADWAIPHLAARLMASEQARKDFSNAIALVTARSSVEFLLFPPIFASQAIAESFKNALRLPSGECLATIEPTAGLRLNVAMEKGLARKGITVEKAARIEPVTSGKRIQSLRIQRADKSQIEIQAEHYILATGKFLGGGIQMGYQHNVETVFDLPLYLTRSQGEMKRRNQILWSEHSFHEEQPWAKLGVWVGGDWKPMDVLQTPVYENLLGCGSVIGGVDFSRQQMGMGFMAYTGRECACAIA